MSFCWHIFFILIGLLLQIWLIKCVYDSSKRIANKWDELLIVDDDVPLMANKVSRGESRTDETTKFLRYSDEEDTGEENVTFDSMRHFKNNSSENTNVTKSHV